MANKSKFEIMQAAALEVSSEKSDLLVIASPAQPPEKKAIAAAKRDKRIASYLTTQEKEDFLALIGRDSESDAIRELILKMIKDKIK